MVELGPGSARKTRRAAAARWWRAAAATATCRSTSRRARSSSARSGWPRSTTVSRSTASSATSSTTSTGSRPPPGRRLIAFLGGTIGNLDEPERRAYAAGAAERSSARDDRLLVGTDLVKDRARLEAAYNDSAGVTAEFNRNVLHVINANLGADLDPDRFEHVAFYNEAEQRIEMWLRAREEMRARIEALDMDVGFERGRADPHRDLVQVHARGAGARVRGRGPRAARAGTPIRTGCSRCR